MKYGKPNKCQGCLFLQHYEDIQGRIPICGRNTYRLSDAISAYEAPDCPWHITKADIIRMQDQAALQVRIDEARALNPTICAVALENAAKAFAESAQAAQSATKAFERLKEFAMGIKEADT